MAELRRVGDVVNVLGECPTWSQREQKLYWVDVRRPGLHRLDPRTMKTDFWAMPELIGSLAVRERGGLLLALATSLSFFDPEHGTFETVAKPLPPGLRFNDGRCDRQGRFWVGSMNDVTRQPVGSLYRFDLDRRCVEMDTGVRVPNAMCFSPDGRTMYFGDSDLHAVFAYPFDTKAGSIGERRKFASTTSPAVPDGATIDEEGFMWLTEYGGWRVVRYAPNGRLDRVIEMPVQNPTSCAFGGEHLETLYVTSASQRLTPEQLEKQPLAGALFSLDVGVRGVPEPTYAG